MARLLLLLLLLCTVHTATVSPQHHTTTASLQHYAATTSPQHHTASPQGCGVHPRFVPATHAPQCPAPPCVTTNNTVSLFLPVLLSLERAHQAGDGGSAWDMILHLLSNTGVKLGKMYLRWHEKQSEVAFRGTTCGGLPVNETFPAAPQPGEHWLHLKVEAARRQVTLSHLKASGKVPAVTLTFQDDPPSTVVVYPRTTMGYSTPAPDATSPITAIISQILIVIIALVTISVVWSVVILVLLSWGWPGARTLRGFRKDHTVGQTHDTNPGTKADI